MSRKRCRDDDDISESGSEYSEPGNNKDAIIKDLEENLHDLEEYIFAKGFDEGAPSSVKDILQKYEGLAFERQEYLHARIYEVYDDFE